MDDPLVAPERPHGPSRVNKENRQVALPAKLMEAIGLSPGDVVYFAVDGDPPEAIVVPACEADSDQPSSHLVAMSWYHS
jgi:hypothetical protein